MNEDDPLVSVVLSTYNESTCVRYSIESILKQTYDNWELIIVDGGSTDGTTNIVNKYCEENDNIEFISAPGTNLPEALNIGIRSARGDFIARIDADDMALPKRLELQAEVMDTNPQIGLLGTSALIISKNNIRFSTPPYEDSEIRRLLPKLNPFIHPTVFIRKKVLQKSGLYDESMSYAEDHDLFIRIAEESTVKNCPRVLCIKHDRLNNMSNKNKFNLTAIRHRVSNRKMAVEKITNKRADYIYSLSPLITPIIPEKIKGKMRNILE